MAGATARWLVLLLVAVSAAAAAAGKHERWSMSRRVGGQVVEKERRRVVAEAEAGTVTAVDVADAAGTVYRLHFITMDPGALFLPVQLHADMVFYVHSGRGKVTYVEEDSGERSSLEVERGDVYNLEQGSIMFIQSYPNATRQRLRIYAIFSSEGINSDDLSKPKVEVYSSVSNLLKGFETEVLRLGFGVQREVAEAIKSTKTPPAIIPYNPQEKHDDDDRSNWTEDIVDALLGVREPEEFLNKKKKDKHKKEKGKKSKSKAFNFYSGKPDVHNCYGWSRTMTNKDLDALHGSDIGMFMVNLTTGSMVGPHWNPKATEIAIVTDGTGIVQVVCPSITSSNSSGENRRGHHRGDERGRPRQEGESEGVSKCRNTVFRVKEGDVFVVPRFHPMAQMSFNNDSFVFVGFSTHMGQNHPQFLAGKGSVLQAIGKEVLALSLGQKNSTAVGKLLSAQRDSTILSCISCAEELEEKAAEEEERREQQEKERKEREEKEKTEREEEERKREQEEKERKEREEEERKREQEERERREREEEERKKEQKERKEREEEERKREQEERERKEEEERQRRKEEERERREQEEKQRRKEEERARREKRQREEEERQREEEEQRREEEEGGGGRGDEPEREEDEEGGDEPPPYRLSKKLKKRYRLGTFRSG